MNREQYGKNAQKLTKEHQFGDMEMGEPKDARSIIKILRRSADNLEELVTLYDQENIND